MGDSGLAHSCVPYRVAIGRRSIRIPLQLAKIETRVDILRPPRLDRLGVEEENPPRRLTEVAIPSIVTDWKGDRRHAANNSAKSILGLSLRGRELLNPFSHGGRRCPRSLAWIGQRPAEPQTGVRIPAGASRRERTPPSSYFDVRMSQAMRDSLPAARARVVRRLGATLVASGSIALAWGMSLSLWGSRGVGCVSDCLSASDLLIIAVGQGLAVAGLVLEPLGAGLWSVGILVRSQARA